MNQWQRIQIAKKTGIDPEAPKVTLSDKWDLIHDRTQTVILKGVKRALAEWKRKQEKIANPLSTYSIRRSI